VIVLETVPMISYQHQISNRSRSLRIKINSDGAVIVVTPKGIPTQKIDQFIEQHQVWILKHQKRNQQKPTIDGEDKVMIFGQWYQKTNLYDSKLPIGVSISGTHLQLNTISQTPTTTEMKRQFERFLKNTAEKYIIPRTHQLAELMEVKFNKITLRQQKSRWGSRSSSGTLSFNWRLVHYPPAVIDYVIIHELAHITHMNHSTKFWQRVGQFDRKYPEHRNYLKKFGLTIG